MESFEKGAARLEKAGAIRIFHRNFVTFVRRLLGVTLIPLIFPNCRLVVFFASCNVRVFGKKHLADFRVVMKLPVVVCL